MSWEYYLGCAEVVVDSFEILLDCAEISIPINPEATTEVAQMFKKSTRLQKRMKAFIAQWKGHPVSRFRALSDFMTDCHKMGIFWIIMECIFKDMMWYDYMMAAGAIVIKISAAVSTGGATWIGRKAIISVKFAKLCKKIYDLSTV